ncbi:hypothetical protein IE982_16515 [Enterobacter hormaechei]|nr:hypothetical protein [Enterobacter hormaechei]
MKAAHWFACWFVCSTVAGDLLIDITTVDNPHKQMAGTSYLIYIRTGPNNPSTTDIEY